MLSIERFAQQHFGITLTEYQVKLIKVITETPEKDYVLHYPTPKAAGKTTAYRVAMEYIKQRGLKPMPTGSITERALRWSLSDDTGTSSQTLCAFMLGMNETNGARGWGASYPPSDAADRGRCIRLLKHIPEWIDRLPEIAEANPGGLVSADHPEKPVKQSWAYQVPLIIKEGEF